MEDEKEGRRVGERREEGVEEIEERSLWQHKRFAEIKVLR